MSKQLVLQQMLFAVLADGNHELVFQKADGSHRVMNATRDPNLVEVSKRGPDAFSPATDTAEQKERKESNVLNVVVYDLAAKDWRSFRIDRLVSINGTGIGTLAGLVGCDRSRFEMGVTYDRYIHSSKAEYIDADQKDPDFISDLIENSETLKLISEKYGVSTWFLAEDTEF
ncbi:tail fiber protein [Aeromonas phage GomatiRiver_11]|nr:hypothetical protein OBDJBBDK_00011 [Aeromonas phage AhFM11]WKW84178.1 tail fiber protein [Aeromonas phage GomatiRiver_11]